MGGKEYTHLEDNKTCDCYVDPHNREVSSSEASASSDEPPCNLTVDTFGETMELSSSQKETKELFEEQDSRGGGLPCRDETSVWRSQNKAGIGDCRKSPKMGHWQEEAGLEL